MIFLLLKFLSNLLISNKQAYNKDKHFINIERINTNLANKGLFFIKIF